MVLGGLWRLLRGRGTELRILQWNCNGIRPKAAQFHAFLVKEKIDIALIQETHLNPHHSFSLGPDFMVVRNDRKTHKGGVMSVFRTSLTRVHRMHIRPPAGVEGQSWVVGGVKGLRALLLHNWYLTPTRAANTNKEFSLNSVKPYMRKTGLLLGDFNCKSPWWGYKGTDSVGRSFQTLVENNNVVFLNEKGVSTLRHGTTPDLTLATEDLSGRCSWRAGDYLGSDHRVILININLRRSYAYTNRIVPLAAKPRTRRRRWTVKRLVKSVKGVFGSIYNLFGRKRARRTNQKMKD